MSKIMIGSMVKHNFSFERGTVLAYRRDPDGYNYQVRFHLDDGGERTDWYKREVLELV
jgi:hypothetical protein